MSLHDRFPNVPICPSLPKTFKVELAALKRCRQLTSQCDVESDAEPSAVILMRKHTNFWQELSSPDDLAARAEDPAASARAEWHPPG